MIHSYSSPLPARLATDPSNRAQVRFGAEAQPEKEQQTQQTPTYDSQADRLPWERRADAPMTDVERRAHALKEEAHLREKLQPQLKEAAAALKETVDFAETHQSVTALKELSKIAESLKDPKASPHVQAVQLKRLSELHEALGRLDDQQGGKSPVSMDPMERELAAKLALSDKLTLREKQGVVRRLVDNLGIEPEAPDQAKLEIVLHYQRENPGFIAAELQRALPRSVRHILLDKPLQMLTDSEKLELEELERRYELDSLSYQRDVESASEQETKRVMHPGFDNEYSTGKKIIYNKVDSIDQVIDQLVERIPFKIESERVTEHEYKPVLSNDEDTQYAVEFKDRPEVLKKGLLNRNGYRNSPEDEVWQQYVFPMHEGNAVAVAPEDSDLPVKWFRYEKKGGKHQIWWAEKDENGLLQHYTFKWHTVRSPLRYADAQGGGARTEKQKVYYALERLNKMLYLYAEKGLIQNPDDNQYWQVPEFAKAEAELEENNIVLPDGEKKRS